MRVKVVDMIEDSRARTIVAGVAIASSVLLTPVTTSAAASPELAKQCLRAAYMLYPYKRPGAAPMSGERLFFFRNCMANQPGSPPPSEPEQAPPSK